jgi:hypothetical protein
MSESARKVIITPPGSGDRYWRADGRRLLDHININQITSVNRTPGGIEFHDEFAAEVRAAIIAAGYTLIDAKPRDTTPTPRRGQPGHNHIHYVSDADDVTILPPDSPGGHWQDESVTCPRCNPDHAAAAGEHRRRIIAQVTRDLHRAGTMPTD